MGWDGHTAVLREIMGMDITDTWDHRILFPQNPQRGLSELAPQFVIFINQKWLETAFT